MCINIVKLSSKCAEIINARQKTSHEGMRESGPIGIKFPAICIKTAQVREEALEITGGVFPRATHLDHQAIPPRSHLGTTRQTLKKVWASLQATYKIKAMLMR